MGKIFVTGTDTGVGKTIFSLLLMQYFCRQGKEPFYLKPLQTGCESPYDGDSDAAFIYRFAASLQGGDPAASVVYCFRNPKAPFFAARDEGKTVDMERLAEIVDEKNRLYSPLIVEGAGGLLVPVVEGTLMADLIAPDASVVLVARAGLGTINHTLLSIEALQKRGLRPAGVVFMDPLGEPPDLVSENMEAVAFYSGMQVAGVIGAIADFSRPPEECYAPLAALFPGVP